jgi:hypothetical protein
MFQEITVERLSVKSIFKLVALGLLLSVVPFTTLMGVFALFGANTVTWNQEHIHGLMALITAPLIGVFVSLVITLFVGSLISLGLWVFSKYKPLTLKVKQSVGEQNG